METPARLSRERLLGATLAVAAMMLSGAAERLMLLVAAVGVAVSLGGRLQASLISDRMHQA